ncbi:MAG: RIP metalloprotease RseP, partial [Gemmatimonadales bacterium]
VLAALILVHELGHFWAAKAVDIEVSRFSIGFGPKLWGFTRGETEYVLSAVPLGGYVKMEGMVGEEVVEPLEGKSSVPRPPSPRDFDQKPLWARFIVIIAGVVMNFAFAVVAFSIVAGSTGIDVPVVEGVTSGMPAAEAGLQAGDVIVEVAGHEARDFSDVTRNLQGRAGEPLDVVVERNNERLTFILTPAAVKQFDSLSGDSVVVGQIGVAFSAAVSGHRNLGFVAAVGEGFRQTGYWAAEIGRFLGRIFSGRNSASELGGPIAIGQLSGQFARAGLIPFLAFMGIISVNLAVLNLLPIPVLDGGHLVFLTVEGLRGRAVSVENRIRLTQVGMLLVLGLMVVAFANDIMRLVN